MRRLLTLCLTGILLSLTATGCVFIDEEAEDALSADESEQAEASTLREYCQKLEDQCPVDHTELASFDRCTDLASIDKPGCESALREHYSCVLQECEQTSRPCRNTWDAVVDSSGCSL